MRYFTKFADRAFKTSPTGARLYYHTGPWSRPYLIPDIDTERKLYKKLVWFLRILLGGLILGQPFIFRIFPDIVDKPFAFLAYLGVGAAAYWLATKVVFASDLQGLSRTDRLSLHLFYAQTAEEHSVPMLALGFFGSLLFVAGGIWALSLGTNAVASVLLIVVFGSSGFAWGYTLFIKLTALS